MPYSTQSYYSSSSNDTSKGYAKAASDASYQYYNDMTWSMWLAVGPGNAKHLWSLWEQISGNNRSWLFSVQTDGTFRALHSWNGTNFSNYKTTSAYADYSWKHVVWTFASGTIGCYINGASAATTVTTAWTGGAVALHNPAIEHIIGAHSPSAPTADTSPSGSMTNFSLWNKVLSAAEVLELYNSGTPYDITTHSAAANLTNWLRMDQTSTSSTLTDTIDSGANATITESGTSGVFNQGNNYPNANPTVIPTAAEIADAVWDEAKSGHVAAGTFGLELGTNQAEHDATQTTLTEISTAVGNLSTSSAGISTTASSFTKAGTEVETLTYTVTSQLDLIYHQVAPGAGSTDVYYQFNVGADGVPTQIEWEGYAQSQGDTYLVYLYNWGATAWEQVGTLSGANGTVEKTETWIATVAHVGTGANDGLVRCRFQSSGGAAGTNLATDRILCTYAVILNSGVVTAGVAQAGSTTSITLASSASSTNGTYDPAIVRIVSGTGSGQSRLILNYVGSSRVATVDRDWRTNPDNTSFYEIISADNSMSRNEGLATAGAASSITLNSAASSVTDTYVGQTVWIVAGTGQDQSRIISAYNGSTKVATVFSAWVTNPDSTSVYLILPHGRADVVSLTPAASTAIANAVWDDATSGHTSAGTFGLLMTKLLTVAKFLGLK